MSCKTTPLRGVGLRFVIVSELQRSRRPVTVAELVELLTGQGFVFTTRPSKAISDCLRTELRKNRVRRLERGVYQFLTTSRSTLRRIHAMALRCRVYVVAQTRPDVSPWDDHFWVWRI